MSVTPLKPAAGLLVLALAAPLPALCADAAAVDALEAEGIERINDGQAVEAEVGRIDDATRSLVDDYQAQLKLVQGLETYITLLDRQLAAQEEEVGILQQSIADVAVIERQVLPLMVRMIDTLKSFVALDVPFLAEERSGRIAGLEALMTRSDVTVAEKSRRVFEAYQIENEYGRTIEAYTAKLELPDASFDAEFLRVGRLGLLYRTVGANRVGFWDPDVGAWRDLPGSPWNRLIEQGLEVARQEVAPQLVHVPVDPSQVTAR